MVDNANLLSVLQSVGELDDDFLEPPREYALYCEVETLEV